jgi:hypothetical protein
MTEKKKTADPKADTTPACTDVQSCPHQHKIRYLGADNAVIPATEAFQVSNHVTNTALPTANTFAGVSTDPDNFRIEVETPHATASPTLEVKRGGVRVKGPYTYTTDKSGAKFRSAFLRLVSDTSDDAASGHGLISDPDDQTILVRLGDTVTAKFMGKEVSLEVGRPVAENDNGANHRKHDIRELTLAVRVLKNPAGNPCVTRAQVETDVADANERYAQTTVRFTAIIDMGGAGDPGLALPADLNGGFTNGALLNPPNAQEAAIIALLDGDAATVDVIYVGTITNGGNRGSSYPQARNQSGTAAWKNFVVIASGSAGGGDPHNLAHELAHVLINAPHRANEPATALLRGGTTLSKAVGGTKRLGPYPDAAAVGVGNADTTTIRTNVSTLP